MSYKETRATSNSRRDFLKYAGTGLMLHSTATSYAGSGVGNLGAATAEKHSWHGQPASALLQLPPQGVVWLTPAPEPD